jgi:uncharacterized membrane protein YtjA (UPF0391 family)
LGRHFDRSYPALKQPDNCSSQSEIFRACRALGRGEPLFQGAISSSKAQENKIESEIVMLSWVVTFLIIALIAGILGFGGIAGVSIEIAKAIFFIAVVLFIVSAVVGLARGRTRV